MEPTTKKPKLAQDSLFTVVGSDAKNHLKRVVVEDQNKARNTLSLHRFAQVGKGDKLRLDPVHRGIISVVSGEDPSDRIRLTPHFELDATTRIGAEILSLKLRELTNQEDLDSHAFLEAFHYKTSAPLNDQDDNGEAEPSISAPSFSGSTGGRKAVLLCLAKTHGKWQAVGYIELQMPLLMVKPRHELLSLPFSHPTRPIRWTEWNQHSIREYVNCIVRVARVVTSPEFRGLGLSRILIDGAKQYAKERWHIGGRRPLFIEISAEMLRHVDFVSGSGFQFAGNTEGNLERIHRDMLHMRKNYEISSGIMSLQKKYLTQLRGGAKLLGKSLEEMIALVADAAKNPQRLGQLQPAEYYSIRSVLRMPIPYYIAGLDEHAESYISGSLERLKVENSDKFCREQPEREFTVKSGRIRYSHISIQSQYEVPASPHSQAILDSFGIDGRCIIQTIVRDFPFEVSGGNIIFIAGPSGTGKSLLLSALDDSIEYKNIIVQRTRVGKEKYTVGWMADLLSDVPIIELLASKFGMDTALSALNQAGLSEAFVYLKPFNLLSRGQKYRARLAALALGDDQVWLIDEFCADLDPLTAKIVAANLRKHVIKYQRIAVVAAANHKHFLDALRPTRVVSLRQGFAPVVQSYRDFSDELHH